MAAGHRIFARVWDWMSRHEGKRERRFRQEVMAGAKGSVLEVGYGVGSNWPFLPPDVEYTGIEPDKYMRERARRHALERDGFRALAGDAQALEFPEASFDTVVGTLVFCTIPDADAALAEVLRVLKPGGEFRFWEHVRARGGAGARAQDLLTPIWKQLGGGCHPNRDTLAAIRRAGFEVTSVREVKIGPLPAIVGVARRPATA